jgi:DNA-binding NarL/FixJ family response regulator
LFVESVAAALRNRGHEVVVTTTPADGVRAVDEHEPDLCVFDLQFRDSHGIGAVTDLRDRHPSCPIVVLSASVDRRDMAAAAAAGVAGFLRKDQPVTAIFDALDRIAAGRAVGAPPPPRGTGTSNESIRVARLLDHLTGRERQVLQSLVEAQDTVGIARSLGVAPSTARTHLQNVLLKLGVHNRMQAVALVVGAGMDGVL